VAEINATLSEWYVLYVKFREVRMLKMVMAAQKS